MRPALLGACLLLAAGAHAGCDHAPTRATPLPPVGPSVRLVYAVPMDRALRPDYLDAMTSAVADLRGWYRDQVGNMTFSLHRAVPDVCPLPESAAFYLDDTWTRVVTGVQTCLPLVYDDPDFRWIVYADVAHRCNAPGRIGAASRGVAIMGSGDLEGLTGQPVVGDCGQLIDRPLGRWIGGAGHELGHTFGLSHPPGCAEGLPSCEDTCLMWLGYLLYPNTYLREPEKAQLRASPFFR